MSVIADIIFIALIVTAYVFGYKKGLVKSVWKIAALAITILGVMGLKDYAVGFMNNMGITAKVQEALAGVVSVPQGGGVNIAEMLHLPEFLQPQVDAGITAAAEGANTVSNAASSALTGVVITIAACVILFVIIRLLLMAVYMIVDTLSKAPVIKTTNKFFGGVLSAVNMAVILLVVLALITVFVPANNPLFEIIDHSYIVKHLYNNNVILKLFMK